MTRGGFEALDPCVHCGFCLPACPTYLATGDESDSPRGRILLMRALERGELPAGDPAVQEHLALCLGCRGCEPVCPAGVGYGLGLEAARERLAAANGIPRLARWILAIFRSRLRWWPLLTAARWLRATGIPAALAGNGRLGFAMGMLASSAAVRQRGSAADHPAKSTATPPHRRTAALFRGCVMDTLFHHVHDATRRALEANGYRVVEVVGQSCCGALHAHAGDRTAAHAMLVSNLAAFAGKADYLVVNSAGCGAWLRGGGAESAVPPVRDVSELLAEAGPRVGAPLPCEVAYDPPCHLEHAQGVREAPLALLSAIPGLKLHRLPGAERCCGAAGIYGLQHPEMARAVLDDKIATLAAASPRPTFIATGNPGCLMQIGAGLRAKGLHIGVVHPVELLDASYRLAGFYAGS
ncbi:MAG TPA: (Fe-S)-binding protein [Gemmatimonadales bacterium]|jgi:glycolate oxidase iron-sulfur subunit|nr:(Fe-S)-binding protein [Gemmatimonadales bacterium]